MKLVQYNVYFFNPMTDNITCRKTSLATVLIRSIFSREIFYSVFPAQNQMN